MLSHLYGSTHTSVHDYWDNNISDYTDHCWPNVVFFFNMLFTFVTLSLPGSKRLLLSWLQWESALILDPKKIKSVTASTFSSYICHEVMRPDTMILAFLMLNFNPLFHSPLLPSSKSSLASLRFLPLDWCHLPTWGCWYFSRQSWLQLVIHPAQHFTWCTLHIS